MRDLFIVITFERFEIKKKPKNTFEILDACARFEIFSLTIQPFIDLKRKTISKQIAHLRHFQNNSITTNCNAMYVKKLEFLFCYFERRTNRSRDIAFLLNK